MVQADVVEFPLRFDAVQVGVIQGQATAVIFVDERKGRTGDALVGWHPQAPGDSLHEEGLASAQVADQADQIAGLEAGAQTLPCAFGRFRTMPLVLGMDGHLEHI